MKYLIIYTIFSILLASSSEAQTSWAKKMPERGFPQKMIKTTDGGYVLLALTSSNNTPYNKMMMIKCDENGDVLWIKKIALVDSSSCNPMGVIETKDNNYIITGYFIIKQSYFSAFIVKLNNVGETLWLKIPYPGQDSYFLNILELNDSSVITVGGVFTNLVIHKFDFDGNLINIFTNEQFKESRTHFFMDLNKINPIIMKNYSDSTNIYKTNNNLVHIFDKYYKGINDKINRDYATQSTDGGFGYLKMTCWNVMSTQCDTISALTKLNKNLDSLWSHPFSEYKYNGFDYQIAKAITPTSDGGFAFCGYVDNTNIVAPRVFLIRTDSFGYSTWDTIYWLAIVDNVVSIVQHDEGGFVMFQSGNADSTNVPEMWLVKTDPMGRIVVSDKFQTPQFNTKDEIMKVFPNPAFTILNIQFNSVKTGTLELRNITGNICYKKEFKNLSEFVIELSPFPVGFYLISFMDKENSYFRYNKKFIKQ